MIWFKLGAVAVVLGLLAWLGVIVNGWRADAAQVPVLEERIEQANALVLQERKGRKDAQAASKGYQDELTTLRAARAAAPARTVRLCNVPAGAAPAPTRPGEPGFDAAAAAAGQLPQANERGGEPGPDIGPDLFAIADDADAIVAQCRGLQELERSRAAP